MKKLTCLILVWFALGTGVATLVGELMDKHILASWTMNGQKMAISTAAAVICLSIAFAVHLSEHRKNLKQNEQ